MSYSQTNAGGAAVVGGTLAVETARRHTRFSDFVELTKLRLTSMAVIATIVGYDLGSSGGVSGMGMVLTLFGALMLGGGVNALNEYWERDLDALMRRTAGRPLPAGRMSLSAALTIGLVMTVLGVAIMAVVHPLAGAVAVAIAVSYVLMYTPLKRLSPISTWVGAVPGALPILMGYVAGSGRIDAAGLSLFSIIFLWQIPHFWAICWRYREDYSRAGFPMTPVSDEVGQRTAWQSVTLTILLFPLALSPTFLGLTGWIYLFGAILAGSALLAFMMLWAAAPSPATARKAFLGTILHLTFLMMLMLADKHLA